MTSSADRAAFYVFPKQMRQQLVRSAVIDNAATAENQHFIGNGHNALLVGNDDLGGMAVFSERAEYVNELLEAPNVDAGFRLIKQFRRVFLAKMPAISIRFCSPPERLEFSSRAA